MRTRIALAISMITVMLLTLIFAIPQSSGTSAVSHYSYTTTTKMQSLPTEHQLWSAQRHQVIVPVMVSSTQTITTTTVVVPPEPAVSTTGSPWDSVARCEEGGWGNYGFPAYPDSLGINSANYYLAASSIGANPNDLSPANQIAIAEALVASWGQAGYVPDQNGCAAW